MFYLRAELKVFAGGEFPWVNWEAEHFQLLHCCLSAAHLKGLYQLQSLSETLTHIAVLTPPLQGGKLR